MFGCIYIKLDLAINLKLKIIYCRSQTLQKYSFGWAVDILKCEFRHNKS